MDDWEVERAVELTEELLAVGKIDGGTALSVLTLIHSGEVDVALDVLTHRE